MQVAIADEIAAKESMQVQQPLSQPVNAVTKDSPALSSRRSSSTSPVLPPAGCQGSSPTLVPHVAILTILDLNADSEMLCVTTAMEVDILLESVRKVE